MNLIYINGRHNSVTEAQIFTLIKHYAETGIFGEISLLQGYLNAKEKKRIQNLIRYRNFKVIWFRTFPNFMILYLLTVIFFRFALRNYLKKVAIKNTILHVKGEFLGSITAKYLAEYHPDNLNNLLVDIRGAYIPEIENYFNQNIYRIYWKKIIAKRSIEYISSRKINISAVSERLKKYLIDELGFDQRYISVNHNIVDESFIFNRDKRRKLREELKLKDDDIVAVFLTGGSAAWQKDSEIVDYLLKKDIKILNLSLQKIKQDGVINQFIPFKKVPDMLSASDFAVLWRDKNIVNYVASPSKFSEFCANGLPVLHNDSIDMVTEYINNNNHGQLVNNIEEFDLNKFPDFSNMDFRLKMSDMGLKVFGVITITASYINLYKSIIERLGSQKRD